MPPKMPDEQFDKLLKEALPVIHAMDAPPSPPPPNILHRLEADRIKLVEQSKQPSTTSEATPNPLVEFFEWLMTPRRLVPVSIACCALLVLGVIGLFNWINKPILPNQVEIAIVSGRNLQTVPPLFGFGSPEKTWILGATSKVSTVEQRDAVDPERTASLLQQGLTNQPSVRILTLTNNAEHDHWVASSLTKGLVAKLLIDLDSRHLVIERLQPNGTTITNAVALPKTVNDQEISQIVLKMIEQIRR